MRVCRVLGGNRGGGEGPAFRQVKGGWGESVRGVVEGSGEGSEEGENAAAGVAVVVVQGVELEGMELDGGVWELWKACRMFDGFLYLTVYQKTQAETEAENGTGTETGTGTGTDGWGGRTDE